MGDAPCESYWPVYFMASARRSDPQLKKIGKAAKKFGPQSAGKFGKNIILTK